MWYDEDTVNFSVESAFARLNQRSVLAFLLLTIIAGAVSFFLLKKADTAINEIESIQSAPVFIARKEYMGDTEFARISGWKTYRNEEYGFEIQYPADFDEKQSYAEFGAAGGRMYREVYVNVIPPVASFREYLDGLAFVRARATREGRLVIFEKGLENVVDRQGFHEEFYDHSISSFAIRTFVDFTPRAIVSVTVRQNGALGSVKEAPVALKNMSREIISTFRRVP